MNNKNFVFIEHGFVKCNVNASFHVQSQQTSWEMRIRDEEGYFVLAKSAWMVPCVCALVLEGESFASIALGNWFGHVTCNLWITLQRIFLKLVSSISDCRELLSLFPNFWVELVRPQANIIVHILVGVAIDNTSPSIYHMIPYFIVLTINNEMLWICLSKKIMVLAF